MTDHAKGLSVRRKVLFLYAIGFSVLLFNEWDFHGGQGPLNLIGGLCAKSRTKLHTRQQSVIHVTTVKVFSHIWYDDGNLIIRI